MNLVQYSLYSVLVMNMFTQLNVGILNGKALEQKEQKLTVFFKTVTSGFCNKLLYQKTLQSRNINLYGIALSKIVKRITVLPTLKNK